MDAFPAHFGFTFTKEYHTKPTAAIDPGNVTLPAGYSVIVTGAGKGIGEFIAKAYARAKASNILITSRTASDLDRVKKELESINPKVKVITVPGDASKAESYVEIKSAVDKELDGGVDCLVCNAGPGPATGGWGKNFDDIDPEEWVASTAVNYFGPFYAIKYLMGSLKGHKTIINISSGASHITTAGFAPPYYAIAKHAQNRLSQWVGESFADTGLTCVSLHPGGVWTPSTETLSDERKAGMAPFMKDDIGLCGAVCVWLSKESRPWTTGRYFAVNWDYEEVEGRKDEIVKNDLLKFRMAV